MTAGRAVLARRRVSEATLPWPGSVGTLPDAVVARDAEATVSRDDRTKPDRAGKRRQALPVPQAVRRVPQAVRRVPVGQTPTAAQHRR
jgi:hypothetical protein